MSKRKSKSDTKQLSLFDEYLRALSTLQNDNLSTEGTFNITNKLRNAIRNGIKGSPLSIHQVAGEMSHLLGETITAEKIYSWTRQSDELNRHPRRYIPCEFIPAFCRATGCNDALVIMGKLLGMFVLPGPDATRAETQKLKEQRKKINTEIRKREALLKALEETQ